MFQKVTGGGGGGPGGGTGPGPGSGFGGSGSGAEGHNSGQSVVKHVPGSGYKTPPGRAGSGRTRSVGSEEALGRGGGGQSSTGGGQSLTAVAECRQYHEAEELQVPCVCVCVWRTVGSERGC